jgi:hypothetical protein
MLQGADGRWDLWSELGCVEDFEAHQRTKSVQPQVEHAREPQADGAGSHGLREQNIEAEAVVATLPATLEFLHVEQPRLVDHPVIG